MIKGLKKTLLSIFIFNLMFLLGLSFYVKDVEVKAEEGVTSLSNYARRVGDLQTTNLMGGVTLYKERVQTMYNGIDTGITDPSNAKYPWHNNTVQWVDLPATSEDVKIVSWTKGTKDGWASATVRTAALDYEAKNPGWIVVAAVNGDSFDINGTKEPTKLHVQNGDIYQPNVGYTQIGWEDDNTLHLGGATLSDTMYVQVLDESGNIVKSAPVARVNTTPSETGITVLTKDMANAVDLTGYKVYVGEYDACRISKANQRPFVKGTIRKVVDNLTLDKPQQARDEVVREFYLVSKDGSLDQLVSVNSYVRCQYPLTGAWENVQNVVCGFGDAIPGYANAQILSNKTPLGAGSAASFVNTTHPRTFIGFKEDGSTVLMVSDGRGKPSDYEQGLSYFQGGELMRLAGCKEAFNLDGGGSSTLIVRNQYGGFEVVNRPSDGSERSIGNAILFVMRDPGLKWDMAETTRNAIAIKKDETNISEQLQDVKVTINGITKTMEGNQFLFEGLEEDTEYDVLVTYKVPSEKDPTKLLNGSFRTKAKTAAFLMPNSGIVFEQINKTSVKVVKKPNVYASWFQDVVISMGGNEYIMGNENELLIEDLISDTEYDVTITYNVVEEGTGNVYPGSETKTLKTLSYELPTITAFNVVREYSNKIIIKCEYKDPDKKVKKAVLYVNEEEIILETTSGNKTITDLDFEANEYTFQMVLTYEVGIGRVEKVSSEKIEYKHEGQTKHNITYQLDGGTNEEGAPVEYTEGIGIASLPVPTKEGYRFLGWYKGETKVESISKEETTDITLTAKWEQIQTTVEPPLRKGCKCKKSSMEYIVTLTTTLSLAIFLFRKKK